MFAPSYTLEKKEDEITVECTSDVVSVGQLRQDVSCCFARLQEVFGERCELTTDPMNVDLLLEVPQGEVEQEWLHKVFVMGSFCSGKTMLIERYVHNIFRPGKATIGVDFFNKSIRLNNHLLRFQIWDATGNTNYLSMMPVYLRETAGIVLTVDLSRDCERELKEAEMFFQDYILRFTDFPKTPVILVGTKSDTQDLHRIPRSIVEDFAQSLGIPYLECSARTSKNVSQVFNMLGKMILTQQSPRYVCRMSVKPFDPVLLESPEFNAELYRVVHHNTVLLVPPMASLDIASLQYHKTVLFFKHKTRDHLYHSIKFYLRCTDNYCLANSEEAISALRVFQKETPQVLCDVAVRLISNLSHTSDMERKDSLKLLSLLNNFMDTTVLKRTIIDFYRSVFVRNANTTVVLNLLWDILENYNSVFFREEAIALINDLHRKKPSILMAALHHTLKSLTAIMEWERKKARQSCVLLSRFIDLAELKKVMIHFYLKAMRVETDSVLLLKMVSDIPSVEESVDKMLSIVFFASVTKGHFASVRFMLEYCDVPLDQRNSSGQTAFMIASEKGYKAMADYLLKEKAKQLNAKRIDEEDPEVERRQFRSVLSRK